jgi:hypothetical protein
MTQGAGQLVQCAPGPPVSTGYRTRNFVAEELKSSIGQRDRMLLKRPATLFAMLIVGVEMPCTVPNVERRMLLDDCVDSQVDSDKGGRWLLVRCLSFRLLLPRSYDSGE